MLRHELRPGDLGAVVHLHGVIYAREYGLDITFEPYVAVPLSEFISKWPQTGRLWLAEKDGSVVGSIAVVKTGQERQAQLRWFVLSPEVRGIGLGQRMLQAALDYCTSERLDRVVLWTLAELKTAIALYESAGFKTTEVATRDLWGAPRAEFKMELRLARA